MKAQINFKVYNPDYDQEYADQYKCGEQSESNWKYISEVGYEIKDVESVELIENGEYRLKGKKGNAPFDVPVPEVAIFRCHLNDGTVVDFGASRSILNKTNQARNEKYKTIRCYFYLNSEPACAELGNLWIDENNIPKH